MMVVVMVIKFLMSQEQQKIKKKGIRVSKVSRTFLHFFFSLSFPFLSFLSSFLCYSCWFPLFSSSPTSPPLLLSLNNRWPPNDTASNTANNLHLFHLQSDDMCVCGEGRWKVRNTEHRTQNRVQGKKQTKYKLKN